MIDLVYCAAGNARFARIAIDHGFLYGAQLPHTSFYFPLWFADQDWKVPRRAAYMRALAQHRPYLATVMDLEHPAQRQEVLEWAEEAAAHVSEVLIIPKYSGAIRTLPTHIGGKAIRLGYSVPTSYGGTTVPVLEFGAWPVHLLGGNPRNQLRLAADLNVVSADGNAIQRAALWNKIFDGHAWVRAKKYYGRHIWERDLIYRCFEESCQNLMAMWRDFYDSELVQTF